jgi:hypothetical protein
MFSHRQFAALVCAGLMLCATGCGKSNEGKTPVVETPEIRAAQSKIVGVWKLLPGSPSGKNRMHFDCFEFTADGKVVLRTVFEYKDPSAGKPEISDNSLECGTYTFISGDEMDFMVESWFAKPHHPYGSGRKTIQIEGDNLTMTGTAGTLNLARVK